MKAKPDWQNRRAELLHAACGEAAQLIEAGEAVTKALRRVAPCYRGRSLRTDGRRLKLSYKTFVEKWYRWRGNRTLEALALHYRAGRARIDRAPLLRVARHCAGRGLTARQGFALLQERGAILSFRTFARAVPVAQLSRLARLRRELENERQATLATLEKAR